MFLLPFLLNTPSRKPTANDNLKYVVVIRTETSLFEDGKILGEYSTASELFKNNNAFTDDRYEYSRNSKTISYKTNEYFKFPETAFMHGRAINGSADPNFRLLYKLLWIDDVDGLVSVFRASPYFFYERFYFFITTWFNLLLLLGTVSLLLSPLILKKEENILRV